ncbi:hypothetical protein Celaphus_00018543 [Cervus elaphus hippelaphus]|uniref:Ig-like domain-containing protein n=1 Tax=Cervus elaphus hippelaphus TaxID=46360 RepID=A0A212CMD5_CEREH|nr:hypothetical protein Celaphus_00018543 [Cervus elaphus hippelaphus]
MTVLLPLLLGLSLGCTGAGGFVAHVESTCLLDDDGNPKDFSYCISFNKDLLTCWDPLQASMVPRPPTVQVAKTTPFNTRESVMLACYVWGFYPADVIITWRRNEQEVLPHGRAHKIVQPNGDWTYQTVSHLATTPSLGDTYTSVPVSAAPGLSPVQTVKVSLSLVTLVLGLIVFVFGLRGWRRATSSGQHN